MQIQNYRQSRNVPSLEIVPAKLRKHMLRNCVRFEMVVSRDDNVFLMQKTIETALDDHTTKLFHLNTDLQRSLSVSLLYVNIYFEKYDDMERFQKHFMLLYKLST